MERGSRRGERATGVARRVVEEPAGDNDAGGCWGRKGGTRDLQQ